LFRFGSGRALAVSVATAMAAKGAGKGVPPPPKAKAPTTAAPPPKAKAKAGGVSVEEALKGHKFKNTGVVTHVTSRMDVEKAFAKIQPSRVRNANKLWQETYGQPVQHVRREEGGKPRKRVHYPEGESTTLGVHEFEIEEGAILVCPAPWSLGAGVTQAYKESALKRMQELTDPSFWPPFPMKHSADVIWSTISLAQKFPKPTSVYRADDPKLPAKDPAALRFVCVSDTHGKEAELTKLLPEGDVLLHGGDFTMAGGKGEVEAFGRWLRELPYARKVVIAGNHDLSFDEELRGLEVQGQELVHDGLQLLLTSVDDSVTYLRDEEISIDGVRIYGAPWQPEFGDWAFCVPRGPPLAEKWAQIPSGVDILITHGPPLGRGDLTKGKARAGCADLLRAIQGRVRPQFNLFGHIHEGAGVTFDGVTHFVNACSVDYDYRTGTAPLVFDVLKKAAPASGG